MGAAHVTTVEYMKITTDHPKLSSLHPDEVADQVIKGVSSIQHML
jgi:hypothetical protein